MAAPLHEFHIALDDFDRSKLPEVQRDLTGDAFRLAVRDHFLQEFADESGSAQVIVTTDRITVRWNAAAGAEPLTERGIQLLAAGDYAGGIALLRQALRGNPEDASALFNLGMALSDQNQLREAVDCLQQAIQIRPNHAPAWVALGVAKARNHDSEGAVKALRKAVEIDPDDGYARRNLGAFIAKLGESPEEALDHLTAASRLMPNDASVWLGLGQLHERMDALGEADDAYKKAIALDRASPIAKAAEEARSQLAHQNFRAAAVGGFRPDALAYCLSALKLFAGMKRQEVQQITFEIAMLGTKGIEVNDPRQKYSLRTLPGQFSGLHLLCLEYVGFKILDPSVDIGFDVSNEYLQAKQMMRDSE